MNQPLLFPLPRLIHQLDPAVRHQGPLTEILDPSLPGQGFELRVTADEAVLRHADAAGLRYGRSTVAQLRNQDGTLPSVHLCDHPDYPVRGFMLDISRDRVPTRETLDRLVEVLEICRFNHLQLYTEHTFAYRDHEEVWAAASPMTGDDLRWLRDRCDRAGIELAANQNCFGHFGRWLALDRYRARAECPDGFDFLPGIRFPPTVLAPTADNAVFVQELVREQVAAFGAGIVNVGCDETFELGRGVSRELVEREGMTAVYARHLHAIVEPLLADGLAVQYWGDVIARHPEHLHLLPSVGMTALVWNYDAPDAPKVEPPPSLRDALLGIGIDLGADSSFEHRLEPFAGSDVAHWVCPGTSTWNSLIGRLDNALGNVADAARAGLGSGAAGFLLTDWGDGGHHQPLTVSYPTLAYGGAVAWGVVANAGVDVAPVIDRYLFADTAGIIGGVLDRVGRVAARTGVVAANASPLHAGLFPGSFTFRNGDPDPDSLQEVLRTLDGALTDLGSARPAAPGATVLVGELSTAIALARLGAQALAADAGLEVPSATARATELDQLIEDYRKGWLATSRPGGLEDSVAHLSAARDHLQQQR